ncbi:endonuclease/exonuclease/phosphatase family protein [Actinomycetospora cinnamomea]|uniref:Endonuclease/exonuclease/phosphatase (EEP) superfamily protein YafD n=1 Tax=Actinomycetospora cinnamomea TaxID=663609 RepID=A0A2U1E9B2_9PSEU|nr:endonuclease/exonuclease/phosphatase family protein [Actinomycetospora cinnamomea]PVY96533.1 endonuclease/exonuclease/phosphatase (EEP) superfamily protein YafD [Actinomycetospora cinnamomea]
MATVLRRLVSGVLWLGAAVAALWVPFWWWAPIAPPEAFALLALTPVAAALALAVGVVALVLRRRAAGAVALVAGLVLAAVVVPRAVDDRDPGGAPGPGRAPVVVATVNLQFGRGDPAAVTALVREQRVDVLGLQEVTPEAEQRLVAAGLRAELPFTESAARPGAGGTAIVSRHPLVPSGLTLRPGEFSQVTARVLAPAGPVDVVVAHPEAPVFRGDPAGWAREIADLPAPAPAGGTARLVLGDLNATLDHRPLRRLLADGTWRDAGASLGAGLRGTWPTDGVLPPFAAIDHVLVSGPATPTGLVIRRLPTTDHAGLVVTLLVRDGRAGVTPGA